MIKYLYGKKCYLNRVITGEAGLRFSDLSHYARLENELMKDEEMSKTFLLDKNTKTLVINEKIIPAHALASDIAITFKTRHCYCLCLSNRKNEPELFKRFQADICIEIKVNALIEFLTDFFSKRFQGMLVEGREIIYYENDYIPHSTDPYDLVFYKPKRFILESEYRIALFYPEEKEGFKSTEGKTVDFINPEESVHMIFQYPEKDFMTQFIGNVYELERA